MALLEVEDLEPFADIDPEKAQAMIDDASAWAERVAPCINDTDFEHAASVKAILRGAVLRWNDQGSGAGPALVAGPYQMTPQTSPRRFLLFPSEVTALSRLCGNRWGKAFSIDTIPADEEESGS